MLTNCLYSEDKPRQYYPSHYSSTPSREKEIPPVKEGSEFWAKQFFEMKTDRCKTSFTDNEIDLIVNNTVKFYGTRLDIFTDVKVKTTHRISNIGDCYFRFDGNNTWIAVNHKYNTWIRNDKMCKMNLVENIKYFNLALHIIKIRQENEGLREKMRMATEGKQSISEEFPPIENVQVEPTNENAQVECIPIVQDIQEQIIRKEFTDDEIDLMIDNEAVYPDTIIDTYCKSKYGKGAYKKRGVFYCGNLQFSKCKNVWILSNEADLKNTDINYFNLALSMFTLQAENNYMIDKLKYAVGSEFYKNILQSEKVDIEEVYVSDEPKNVITYNDEDLEITIFD